MEGKLVIFTAPSGAGKTTLVRHLLEYREDLEFSVSAATRPRRYNEKDGKDYYFITPEKFQEKIKQGEFVEWEEVYTNNFYGTLKSEIDRIWQKGKHVIFDIDVQGALRIKKKYGDKALGIFVKPPSPEILFKRLKDRATEDDKSLEERITKAKTELEFENRFDVIIINDDLRVACEKARSIVNDFLPKEKLSNYSLTNKTVLW